MKVKQRYRLTRRLATANIMSVKFLPPPTRPAPRVGEHDGPSESYLSLVVTLQNLFARICHMLAYVAVPKIWDAS